MAENSRSEEAEQSANRPEQLTADQRRTLEVLGYLFLRMGQFEKAKLLFGALAALAPDDRWAQRNLAAVAASLGDYPAALEHLRLAVGDGMLPSCDAAVHLLRARILWGLGRREEARNAVDVYLAVSGDLPSKGRRL